MKALSSPWQVSAGEGLGCLGDADHVFRVVTACPGQHLSPASQPLPPHTGLPLREFINQVLEGLCIFILPPLSPELAVFVYCLFVCFIVVGCLCAKNHPEL